MAAKYSYSLINLLRFLALCRALSLLIKGTNGSCSLLSITTTGHACSIRVFDECSDDVRSVITVTHATITHSGTSVDATEAANDIIQCSEKSCTELAFFLLAHYSAQFCMELQVFGSDFYMLTAEIAVSYSGGSENSFSVMFAGMSDNSVFGGDSFPTCSTFSIESISSGPTSTPGASSSLTQYTHEDCDEQVVASTSSTTTTATPPATTPTTTPPAAITTASLASSTQPTSVELETTNVTSSSAKQSATASFDLGLLFYPGPLEQRIFEIGTNLSKGQSVEIDNIYVYRSILRDLCSTGWKKTNENENQYFWPSNYFCDVLEGRNETAQMPVPVILGIASSAHLAELYNDFLSKNATIPVNKDIILQVASNIITSVVFIGNESVSLPFGFNLTHSIMLTHELSSPSCRFFHEQNRNWNTTGCITETGNDPAMTSCYCDHMTSFAILVRVLPYDPEVDVISDIITWSGLGLSVTSLIISLITLFALRRSLTADRVIIHVNLMIAILFSDITFFSGTYKPIEIKSICKAFAFVLHYFSLAVMFWMLAEGVHLYRQIIKVFDSGNPRTWLYGILGWGCPAIIQIITGGLKHESYGFGRSCWLNPLDGTMWAFGGPAIAIVLVNVVILVLVVKTVVSASRGQLDNDKIKQIRNGLRSTLLLCPLLGMAWLLSPVLVFFPHFKALQYTFDVLHSLQGFFISLFYCFLNAEVRNAIRERVRKSQDSRNFDTKSGTVSTSERKLAKTGRRRVRVRPAPVSQTQTLPGVSN